ncbi:Uncharacterised protein [Sphingobacterium spiritivorum]|uniref:Uncharacterized protein n=1 Tax=Sphingobacterium spiritivorum TaxID=258 RepID=A0A380C9U0_SPHSI|nr:hypothetical protein [Sphingobacterium spiritivorum]SUJ14674.1 Uncharacterised protein [Sphingobacterium spiritivorum]
MKLFHLTFLILLMPLSTKAQTSPTQDMQYDPENALYWKISNDSENLYIKLYKDEYAQKIRQPGGVWFFFNPKGERDTVAVPTLQFPIFKDSMNLDTMAVYHFKDIPNGELPKYNSYGVLTEGRLEEKKGTSTWSKDHLIYSASITVPLQYIQSSGTKLTIQILLKGRRIVPLPPGAVSPILISTVMGSQEVKDMLYATDIWTHCWIDYEISM